MAAVSTYYDAAGTDTITLTSIGARQGPPALVDGMLIRFRPANANTGAATVAVDGLAATAINREDDTALSAADLVTTRDAVARYDLSADAFFLLTSALFTGPPSEAFKADVDAVNNDFTFWQRGLTIDGSTTFLNSDTFYCADHIKILSDGDDRADFTRQDAAGLIGSRYFLRMDAQDIDKKFGIAEILEGSQTHKYRGGVASFSFKARSVAGIGACRALLMTSDTGEDAAAADLVTTWNGEGLIFTPGTNWTIAGSVVFTPGGTFTQVLLENVPIASGALNLAWVIVNEDVSHSIGDFLEIAETQIEPEAAASAFQQVAEADGLVRCQRYMAKTFPQDTAPIQIGGRDGTVIAIGTAGADLFIQWDYPQTMFRVPDVVSYSPDAATSDAQRIDAAGTIVIAELVAHTSDRQCIFNKIAGVTNGSVLATHMTAVAEMP